VIFNPENIMKEIFNVWKKPRLLVLASYTAAVYAAVVIPFKYGLPLIPGATEIRPGVAVLFLCGFLFGPAAAWGGAFGNLLGDFFGATLGVSSIFGFVGNFLLAYLPYRAWEVMRGGRALPEMEPFRWMRYILTMALWRFRYFWADLKSKKVLPQKPVKPAPLKWRSDVIVPLRWWFRYVLAIALGSGACAGIIAWGLDLAVRLPFFILGTIIFFNNMLMGLVLAPLLLLLIVPRMEAWGFTYKQMESSRLEPGMIARFGLISVVAATAFLMVGGHLFSRKVWIEMVAGWFSMPEWLSSYPPGALAPVVLVLLLGTVLLGSGNVSEVEPESDPHEKEISPQEVEGAVLEDVSFSYTGADSRALDGVSLSIGRGEFVAVMGKTGAGKTTLARCLTGAVPHFYSGDLSGTVMIEGGDPAGSGPAENAHCVGMVFEDFESQLFSTKVSLEVIFGPENLGMRRNRIIDALSSSLCQTGLEGFEDRDPASLSGGEKQRLAVAATLAMDSQMLILDEPTTDLDPLGKRELFDVLDKLGNGKTLMIIEHEAEAAADADRVVLMKDGRIDTTGGPEDILRRPGLLEEHGVRPYDSVKLLDAVGESNPPLDTKAAVAKLSEVGVDIDKGKYSNLLEEEKRRENSYGEKIIHVEGVHYVYPGGNEALRGVDFAVRKGEFIALLGHNGSGKTTLAKHLNGLLEPTSGGVLLDGKPIGDLPLSKVAQRVGYVFQNPDHQIFSATVAEEVAFAPTNFGLTPTEVQRRVEASLEATGLVGRENFDPFHMTKGERQRVAIAGVLAGAPEVIILDEPTTGLDLDEQKSVMELLKRLNREGHTVIIITHAVWVAAEYAHRTVLMTGGRILADGPTRRVFGMEEELIETRVVPPQVTQIGRRAFGEVFLGVDEMLGCIKRGGG